jgi:hypothetical protein
MATGTAHRTASGANGSRGPYGGAGSLLAQPGGGWTAGRVITVGRGSVPYRVWVGLPAGLPAALAVAPARFADGAG